MATYDFTRELALVTGGSGGIGRATCLALAELGCSLAIHYNSNRESAEELADGLRRKGITVEIFQADVNQYDDVRRLHAEVVSRMGNPTILFANAGTSGGQTGVTRISDVSIETFESTWRANCGSAILLAQLCIPAMEQKGWGRVLFCSSVAGFTGGVVGPHYASSKSALHGLIHWLSAAYSAKGITVNGIAPALITGTGMLPEDCGDLAQKIPVGRLGTCEEIAETVLWMVKTGYVTNKVIAVDGGWFIQ